MKKFLAFLLSLLMAGSMLSPGLPAFAQTTTETSTETQEEDTGSEIQAAGEQDAESEGSSSSSDYAEGSEKLDISQGTVPFIDESDPLMENLAVYMVELTTDTLIHSRNANERRYPASLTKIMTAILVIENNTDFNQVITAYVLGGISELSQIRNEHIRMDIDGEIVEDDFLFGAICNSTSIGGILTLDPEQVDMGDGLFEVMLVRMPRSFAELSECLRAVQSQDYNCEMITFRSASHIRVEADPTMDWSLDGEREEGHETVEVENLHHAIHLVQKKADA